MGARIRRIGMVAAAIAIASGSLTASAEAAPRINQIPASAYSDCPSSDPRLPNSFYYGYYPSCSECQHAGTRLGVGNGWRTWFCTYNPQYGHFDLHYVL
jgi:hypothetical protein